MLDPTMSRNIESLLLRRIASVGQKVLAEALDCDISRISRFNSGEASIKLSELGPLLSALGIVATEVGGDSVVLPRAKLRAMKILAREGLRFGDDDEELPNG